MMKSSAGRFTASLTLLWGLGAVGVPVEASPVIDEIDWDVLLAKHDMVWGSLPDAWYEAPFLGNGEQGTMLFQLDDQTLRWDVGCSAAHDHRLVDDDDLSEKHVEVLNRGRLFIGHLEVDLPVSLTGSQSRLSLWNAEAAGILLSAGGSVTWNTLVHATEPVMRFELTPSGDLAGAAFSYVAEEARNPRAVRAGTERVPANPPPVLSTLPDGVKTAVHNLWAGGQTAVAYFEEEVGGIKRLWLSVQHSYPGSDAEALAVAAVRAAAATDQVAWVLAHRTWWHAYYPASFVSTGDAYWDALYWIQQYKLACITRDQGWIIDNQGPWLQPTAWNATWWNLNVQLSHSGVYQANRREMGTALSHRLDELRDHLARNVDAAYRSDSYAIGRTASGFDLWGHAGEPGGRSAITDTNIGRECGNLLWGLHNVDLEVRYWQDATLRDDVLYPLLTRAVNYYRHFLMEEADGLYHLPSTHSPEYANAEDCSYDLDLLRWGTGRLLELADEQGFTPAEEPLIPTWTDLLAKLVPNHTNSTGRMIGANRALTGGHRHWSHLLAVYPLRTLTPETASDRTVIQTSLDHWQSFGAGIAGYAFTGASCMASLLGDGDGALTYLNGLKSYLKPSTMYSEIGLPVMETPLHGAAAMQEMLLQSWGDRLRVFPAVGADWTDVQFHQLRGEGAFLVSARREQGQTKWALVEAEAGGTVDVEPQLTDAQWTGSAGVTVSTFSAGVYNINTSPGDWVLFWPEGEAQPDVVVEPVDQRGDDYRFGLSDGYVEDGGNGLIAGVDFENVGDTAWDKRPDDLNPLDGISVSADWTVAGLALEVISDNGANTAGSTSGSYVAKLNGGSTVAALPGTTPGDSYSWSITIPDDVILDLTSVTFDWRQGTGTASNSRWGMFNTSLDGGPGGPALWSMADPPVRPTWENVSVDLSGATYQGLTDTTVTFYWYTERTGSDIDTIVVSGALVERPVLNLAVEHKIDGADLLLSWNSKTGKVYDLLTSTSLMIDLDLWPSVATGIVASPPLNIQELALPEEPVNFYSLREEPAP